MKIILSYDVENNEKLKKMAKTIEGGVAFAIQIVQEKYEQGFKNICLRTNDIEAVKNKLQSEQVEVDGPIQMERDTHKDGKVKWQLLYIMIRMMMKLSHHFLFNGKKVIPCVLKNCQNCFKNNFQLKLLL